MRVIQAADPIVEASEDEHGHARRSPKRWEIEPLELLKVGDVAAEHRASRARRPFENAEVWRELEHLFGREAATENARLHLRPCRNMGCEGLVVGDTGEKSLAARALDDAFAPLSCRCAEHGDRGYTARRAAEEGRNHPADAVTEEDRRVD